MEQTAKDDKISSLSNEAEELSLLRRRFKQLEEERDDIERQLRTAKRELSDAERNVIKRDNELRENQSTMDRQAREISKLCLESADFEREANQLKQELEKKNQIIEDLKNELENKEKIMKSRAEEERQAREKNEKTIADLTDDVKYLKEDQNRDKETIGYLNSHVQDLEGKIGRKTEEVAKLSESFAQSERSALDYLSRLENAREEINHDHVTIETLEHRVEDLTVSLECDKAEAESEKEKNLNVLNEMQAEMDRFKEDARMKAEALAEENRCRELEVERTTKQLQQQLAAVEQKKTELERTVKASGETIKECSQNMQNLEDRLQLEKLKSQKLSKDLRKAELLNAEDKEENAKQKQTIEDLEKKQKEQQDTMEKMKKRLHGYGFIMD